MNPEKPDKKISTDSNINRTHSNEADKKENQWFHESSQTESEALRAMIGKEKKSLN
jgi:hypothetical protein